MKKFFVCMLLAGLMIPVIAQERLSLNKEVRVIKHDGSTSVQGALPTKTAELPSVLYWSAAGFSEAYDRQCQGGVYPMTKVHDDGEFMACTWTNEDNGHFGQGTTPYRGIGYAYSTDKGKTWSEQENRLGGIPVYWPSYAQWGEKGEAFMARSANTYDHEGITIKNGVVLFTRETRGEGDWTITPVPYPAGIEPSATGYVMAWGHMATSGENKQYIHIICPMSSGNAAPYKGYSTPQLYYRTQDGKTWEVEAVVVPEMLGEDWGSESYYSDAFSFAVQGNTIACSFINWGSHGRVIRSHDNGKTWESIKFFDSPVLGELTPAHYDDTCYIPTQGCLALDDDGKMHIAFAVMLSKNSEQPGYMSLWGYLGSSFLTYWNEDMGTIDGAATFSRNTMGRIVDDYFDWDKSQPEKQEYYVISTVPEWPVIGFSIPTIDPGSNIYRVDEQLIYDWATQSYGLAGCYSFPQMEFNDGKLHLAYLGLADAAPNNSGCWLRHPYYTSRDKDGNWTQTQYVINSLDYIDLEFAYLTSAGFSDDIWYLMAQVDSYAGVYTFYGQEGPPEHDPVKNTFYFFPYGKDDPTPAVGEITKLSMSVFPNPASGNVTVKDFDKGNITVHNMLGQTVYHVENAVKEVSIPLNNLSSGVYFITLRSGSATTTQKLIVK